MSPKTRGLAIVNLLLLALISISLAGCGSKTKSAITPTPAPTVSSFSASAPSISAGDSVTLSWSITNASSVLIDNGVGSPTGSSVSVKPTKTTTYKLTATNSTGSTTSSVTVTVIDLPTIANLAASEPLLSPATTGPAASKLSWEVTGASKLTIDNNVGDVTGTSATVTPAATTTYTLTAANSLGGTSTATVTVKVRNNLSALNGTPFAGTDRVDYLSTLGMCEYPNFLATDKAGNIYATDGNGGAVCKIAPNGNVTVLASNAGSGYYYYDALPTTGVHAMSAHAQLGSGTSKPAGRGALLPSHTPMTPSSTASAQASNGTVNAGLDYPSGIAVTSDGSTVYFSDRYHYRVRKIAIASDGTTTVSDVAGGTYGFADGVGTAAQFKYPMGLAMDAKGNLYVADEYNYAVRKITFGSDGAATVSTLAGNQGYGHVDGSADIAEFGELQGVAVSADGLSVYVTDSSESYDSEMGYDYWTGIRKVAIDSEGAAMVSTLAGGEEGYQDGDATTAQFGFLEQLALTADGTTLYVPDGTNGLVRKIVMATDGTLAVTTAAGKYLEWGHADGNANAAWFVDPFGVALDTAGNLYISSSNNYGMTAMTLRKLSLTSNTVSSLVLNLFGNTGGSADDEGTKASFNIPSTAVTDASGNIYVADSANSTIRKIAIGTDGTGTVSTLAGTAAVYGSADGTGAGALFDQPLGLAIDVPGNTLYVADTGNGTIRKIDLTTAAVTTLAGTAGNRDNESGLRYPWRLAVDSTGLLYVADQGTAGISTVDPASGEVTQLDVTDATNGMVRNSHISGLAVYTNKDKTKSYLYGSGYCAIFKVDLLVSPLTVTTFTGSNVCGYQDGAPDTALFADILGLSVDSVGNIYVVDTENSVIRRVTPDGNTTTVLGSYPSTMMTMGSLPDRCICRLVSPWIQLTTCSSRFPMPC